MDSNAPANGPLPAIPDHQLLRCIGRGSYGEVWLAVNMMGVFRAIKIVYRKSFKDQRPFERELSGIRRFEPISRSHEGFVDVLHVGINEEQGCFYYVMELGDDETSGQKVNPDTYSPKTLGREVSQRGKLSLHECLQLGLALSDALGELHRNELVHRDVKPSNIIFVNGVPKLADIGLVADVGEARSYVGTEGFIPPEGPGTPQADVYSLGKVLYEASTGKDRQDFPELPTLFEKLPDPEGFLELNEVLLQACHNNISKRYQFAWDMHADLMVLANGKSVKRLKVLERRLANFKRIVSISTLVVAILSLVFYQVYRAWRDRVGARQRQVNASVISGNRALESGDLLGSLPHFADALAIDEDNSTQALTHRLRLGSILAQAPKLTQMWSEKNKDGKKSELMDGEFNPSGNSVLITQHHGQARIYDAFSGLPISNPFGPANLRNAVYSPNGLFIATANERGPAQIWDAATLQETGSVPSSDGVLNVKFGPDGFHLVLAELDGLVRVSEDWTTGKSVTFPRRHKLELRLANYSHDGRLIVSVSDDGNAQIWEAKTGLPIGKPLHHPNWVMDAAFSPDDQNLATACIDHIARVWEVNSGRQIRPDLHHRSQVECVEYSPDGRLIVTGSLDGTIRLWCSDNLLPFQDVPILRIGSPISHVDFASDGHRLLVTCLDGPVHIWDLAGSRVPPVSSNRKFSPDGSRFLTLAKNSVQVWDALSSNSITTMATSVPAWENAEFSRDNRFVLSISAPFATGTQTNCELKVSDTRTGAAIAPDILISHAPTGASISADGTRLVIFNGKTAQVMDVLGQTNLLPPLTYRAAVGNAFFSSDNNELVVITGSEVHVLNLANGQEAFPPLEHPTLVHYATFSPDGKRLIVCCSDTSISKCFAQIYDSATGRKIGPELYHDDGVLFASFSPDGKRVVTAGEDFIAHEWDVETGRPLALPLPHEHQVRAASFSPDGRWIITASLDKTARIWDAETGDPLTPPLQHFVPLTDGIFLPDGRHIATSAGNKISWIWQLPVDERPVEDLKKLARLLSGDSVIPFGGASTSQPESLMALWQELRKKYPASFTVSTNEVIGWHEFQAQESELEGQWFAVVFHLQQLLLLHPQDAALLQRLTSAKEHLAAGN